MISQLEPNEEMVNDLISLVTFLVLECMVQEMEEKLRKI